MSLTYSMPLFAFRGFHLIQGVSVGYRYQAVLRCGLCVGIYVSQGFDKYVHVSVTCPYFWRPYLQLMSPCIPDLGREHKPAYRETLLMISRFPRELAGGCGARGPCAQPSCQQPRSQLPTLPFSASPNYISFLLSKSPCRRLRLNYP